MTVDSSRCGKSQTLADLKACISARKLLIEVVIAGWAVTYTELVNSHSQRCVGCPKAEFTSYVRSPLRRLFDEDHNQS